MNSPLFFLCVTLNIVGIMLSELSEMSNKKSNDFVSRVISR